MGSAEIECFRPTATEWQSEYREFSNTFDLHRNNLNDLGLDNWNQGSHERDDWDENRWDDDRESWIETGDAQLSRILPKDLTWGGGLSASSRPLFNILRRWLSECDRNHLGCLPERKFRPTRVIDTYSSRLQLVEESPSHHRRGTYVAVSHCWGSPTDKERKAFCTTRDNYQARLKGFSIEDLPKTFQDAIKVTRAIGKRYLWIDAVCIIQGGDADWDVESKRMEQVFSSAYCTIAVESATDWKKGFLRRSSSHTTVTLKSGHKQYVCNTQHDFNKDVNQSNLNKRAWVLQERTLSRRTLHFTDNHAYFACGRSIRCEDFTTLESPTRREYYLLDPAFPNRLTRAGYDRTIDFIQNLFSQYASASLANESDRNIAILGLLERMKKVLSSNYAHGTFQIFLARLLLWRVTEKHVASSAATVTAAQLPSWSWLSRNHIKFFPESKIEVPAADILRLGIDGALHAQIREIRVAEDSGSDGLGGGLWLDAWDTAPYTHYCAVFGVLREKPESHCCVLLSYHADDDRYRRVGACLVPSNCISSTYRDGIIV